MFFQAIENACCIYQNIKLSLPPLTAEIFEITYDDQDKFYEITGRSDNIESERYLPFKASALFHLPIKCYRKLSDGEDVKPVYEVTFNIENTDLIYEAGDTVGILPENNTTEVASLARLLQLEEIFSKQYKINVKSDISSANLKKFATLMKHIPSIGTLQDLFIYHVNIRAPVKKILLRSISIFCNDEHEKRCMEILCSKEGSELYNKYILHNNSTLTDVLDAFKSCKPPVTVVLQNLPQLLPRPYSICSSELTKKKELTICFSVEENKCGIKGVTSGWLQSLLEIPDQKSEPDIEKHLANLSISKSAIILGDNKMCRVPLYLRESTVFRLPMNNDIPIVMIGTGTGISPFIGFLRERKMRKKENPDLSMGTICLFYGCRYEVRDFLFREELHEYVDDCTLTKLVVSFSRENNVKTYIQDELKSEASLIVEIIDSGGVIYVCGNLAAMEKAVRQSIEMCIASVKKINLSESRDLMNKLRQEQKYITDVWS